MCIKQCLMWTMWTKQQCCLKLCIYVTQYYIRALAEKRLIHKPMLTQKVLSIKRGEVLVCACQLPALRWIQLFTKGHTTSLLKACHCVSSYPRGQRYYNQQLKNRWWFWLNVACAGFPLSWAEFYSNLQTRLDVLIYMCGLALWLVKSVINSASQWQYWMGVLKKFYYLPVSWHYYYETISVECYITESQHRNKSIMHTYRNTLIKRQIGNLVGRCLNLVVMLSLFQIAITVNSACN